MKLKIHKQWRWLARDPSGSWWSYTHEPTISFLKWQICLDAVRRCFRLDDFFTLPKTPWTQSLHKRVGLDGTNCEGIKLYKTTVADIAYLVLTIKNDDGDMLVLPLDLLAFCRAVVEKIDGIKAGMVEEAASCAGMGTTKEELKRSLK